MFTAYFWSDHKKNLCDTNALKGIASALEKYVQMQGCGIKIRFIQVIAALKEHDVASKYFNVNFMQNAGYKVMHLQNGILIPGPNSKVSNIPNGAAADLIAW